MRSLAFVLLFVFVFLHWDAPAQELIYPLDVFDTPTHKGHCVDMSKTPYLCDKSGAQDCSAAIQQAVDDISGGADRPRQMTLYFPNGTYLITKTIDAVRTDKNNAYRLRIVGQSQAGTIIKLGDASPNFQNPAVPLAMIRTLSISRLPPNNAFNDNIWNLTLNAGTNNPGAIGIDYLANNVASVRNVTIKAGDEKTGLIGLQMHHGYPGPCMIENVRINGFGTGVQFANSEYNATIEGLTLNEQRMVGVQDNGALSIRHLTSRNSHPVPALTVGADCLLDLVDSTATFTGGKAEAAAIAITATDATHLGAAFVRNFVSTGYALAISDPKVPSGVNTGGDAPGGIVVEYSSHPVLTPGLPNERMSSLNLPVKETPHLLDNDLSHWYSVGIKVLPDHPNVIIDAAPQIQSAVDAAAAAGKTTLYFPPGKYAMASTVYLHGSIRRVIGFGSYLMPFVPQSGAGTFDGTHVGNLQSLICIGGGPAGDMTGPVEIDDLGIFPGKGFGHPAYFNVFKHNTAQAVAIVDCEAGGGGIDPAGKLQSSCYQNAKGSGELFLDDTDGSAWFFDHPGQKIWARQYNTEGNTAPGGGYPAKIVNVGCTLWILGGKSEAHGTVILTTQSGATEVLGCYLYPVHDEKRGPAAARTGLRRAGCRFLRELHDLRGEVQSRPPEPGLAKRRGTDGGIGHVRRRDTSQGLRERWQFHPALHRAAGRGRIGQSVRAV